MKKKKLSAVHQGVAYTKEKMLVFSVLIMTAGMAQAQDQAGPTSSFNPMVLIMNLGVLLNGVYSLLGGIFAFLGLLVTGFGIYTGIQVLRGAQSVQRMENPWAYVAGAVILGPILMMAGTVMSGMWDTMTVEGSMGAGGAEGW